MYRILIVEDEKIMRNELATMLKNNGYETCCIEEFENVAEQVSKENADLILLDINLPCENGYQICSKIRADMSVPIIFLTSRNSDMDELNSFISGGDDYITKPFNILEVKARIKAIMRRSSKRATEDEKKKIFEKNGLKIDCDSRRVFVEDKEVKLTAKEYDLLELLSFHPNKVYSRENLLNIVWGYDYPGDVRTVDVHIRRLREKIEKNPGEPLYIHTKWGVGYYFQD